jgi:hypothetical protein
MKTYKREVAIAVLLYLGYLGIYGRVEALEVLAWPFMLFVGASFGMDWARKQTDLVVKRKEYTDDELDKK